MTFTYKTSAATGTVELSREGHSLNSCKVTATIEGKSFEASVWTQEYKGSTTATLQVNLLVLNKLGLINAPKRNLVVDIIIEGEINLKTVLNKLDNIPAKEEVKGKFYNGTFWSDEKVAQMTYTEKVFCGIYSE